MKTWLQSYRLARPRAAALPGTIALLTAAAASGILPVSLRAQAPAAAKPAPPRLSVLMGLTRDWQAQASRFHTGTLLGSDREDNLPPADVFAWFQGRDRTATVPVTATTDLPETGGRSQADRPTEDDAPVGLPEHARPTDYAASGFAIGATPASRPVRYPIGTDGPAAARTPLLPDGGSPVRRAAPAATVATVAGGDAAHAAVAGMFVPVPTAGVFTSPGPNVTLGNAVVQPPADHAVFPAAARPFPNAGPFPDSQVGLSALVTVDQQNTAGSNNQTITPTGTGNGQSFTPSLNTLNAITVSLFTTGVASTTGGVANAVAGSSTVRVDLFASATGYTNLLASSAPVTFTNTSYQTIEFDFATLQTVTPGNVYSFRMVLVSGDRISYQFSSTSTYAGGTQLSVTTGSTAVGDVVFAEGIGSSVPEPGTWAGGALLLLGAGWTLRRRAVRR